MSIQNTSPVLYDLNALAKIKPAKRKAQNAHRQAAPQMQNFHSTFARRKGFLHSRTVIVCNHISFRSN